jgi:creatinine amidohydrolase
MSGSVMWKELTAEELRANAAADAIVVLPVGSMEQHGPHLPVGVDTILTEGVCRAGAEAAAGDVAVVVAPTVWCGMAEHHMAFGGTFSFDIPTYRAVLLAFLRSIERHGFKRVLIINGHGGNTAALNAFLPDLARETSLRIFVAGYFELPRTDIGPFLENQTGVQHACEVETSLMMVVAPDLVRHERIAEAFGGLDPGSEWRTMPARFRSFKEITASGVNGDARRASRAKGEKIFESLAGGLANLLKSGKLGAPITATAK